MPLLSLERHGITQGPGSRASQVRLRRSLHTGPGSLPLSSGLHRRPPRGLAASDGDNAVLLPVCLRSVTGGGSELASLCSCLLPSLPSTSCVPPGHLRRCGVTTLLVLVVWRDRKEGHMHLPTVMGFSWELMPQLSWA